MSDLDQLLNTRGRSAQLGAYVTAACFSTTNQAGFALGDGTLRLALSSEFACLAGHRGAMLSLCAHPSGGFCSGGDDGQLLHLGPGGNRELGNFGSKWVEHVASYAGKNPYIAASVGKTLHLYAPSGEKLREMAHQSTISGIAFDAKGKRVATSHYNGASLWFTGAASEPRKLEWKGSHTNVAIHPNGDALVTTMQENALHGWTLPEGKHMRMSGYPAKTESMGFTKSGRWLATAGAESVVLWPFFGGGPMGKNPTELGMGDGIIRRVACHPTHEMIAAGFDTGLAILIDVNKETILPICAPGRGAITALTWNNTGTHLAIGTETGFAALVDFSA